MHLFKREITLQFVSFGLTHSLSKIVVSHNVDYAPYGSKKIIISSQDHFKSKQSENDADQEQYRSELPRSIGSFKIVPTRGPRETVSGQTGLTGRTQSSATKAWKMRNWDKSNLYEIVSHSRTTI